MGGKELIHEQEGQRNIFCNWSRATQPSSGQTLILGKSREAGKSAILSTHTDWVPTLGQTPAAWGPVPKQRPQRDPDILKEPALYVCAPICVPVHAESRGQPLELFLRCHPPYFLFLLLRQSL